MKKLFTITTIFFVCAAAGAQTGCSKFYPFKKGVVSEISMYDQKGKLAAVVEYTVISVNNSASGETAQMASSIKDGKGKTVAESTYDVTCKNDVVSIDFKSLMDPKMLGSFGEMDYEISGKSIDFPNNLSVGQSLPDASMEIKINMGGMMMNISVEMTDRKVQARETVKTPAGSYDSFLITYNSNVKTMGAGQISASKQWISEGVGMVKVENYDKNGKLTGSGLLTKFSQ